MIWTSIRHLLNLYTIFSEPIYCFSQATRVSFNNLSLLQFGTYKHAGEIITTNRYSCLRTYKVFFPDKSQRQVETQGESHAELQNTWETPPPFPPHPPKKASDVSYASPRKCYNLLSQRFSIWSFKTMYKNTGTRTEGCLNAPVWILVNVGKGAYWSSRVCFWPLTAAISRGRREEWTEIKTNESRQTVRVIARWVRPCLLFII